MGDVLWTAGVWFFFYWLFSGIAGVVMYLWTRKEFDEKWVEESPYGNALGHVPSWVTIGALVGIFLLSFCLLPVKILRKEDKEDD